MRAMTTTNQQNAPAKHRRHRTRDEWCSEVARFRASGLRRPAYAERAGINALTLAWWETRLRREARVASGAPTAESPFVPLHVTAQASAPTIEIELASGSVLRVGSDVDVRFIARLARALQSPC